MFRFEGLVVSFVFFFLHVTKCHGESLGNSSQNSNKKREHKHKMMRIRSFMNEFTFKSSCHAVPKITKSTAEVWGRVKLAQPFVSSCHVMSVPQFSDVDTMQSWRAPLLSNLDMSGIRA